ncbi:MAG: tetratricopeptide repeat protein [Pyrinomonadaceae bacterium]
MKRLLILTSLIFAAGCTNAARPVENTANTSDPTHGAKPESMIAHSTEDRQIPPASETGQADGAKWSQGGEAIDTTKFDAAISTAEKKAKATPNDGQAKKEAAQAYFERGFALTNARQYASALGDYRRALKYDPTDEDAKNWIDQIVSIYGMLKKQPPAEGQEPPPLPWKAGKQQG